ncbi:DUF485 domain-containing protein [Cytobacillus praedii]|nr:DUF485 domain-containing protein [Cytobacillus praedii]
MGKTVQNSNRKKGKGEDFEKMVRTSQFNELMAAKKKFLVPSIIIFLGLYLLFPILISYTNALDNIAIGDISWAWVYALLLFVMTWVMATIYMKKSAVFDRMAEKVWKDEELERREAK